MKAGQQTLLSRSHQLIAEAAVTRLLAKPKHHVIRRRPRSRVAVLSAESYSDRLEQVLWQGLNLFHLDVRGKTVLLKPNLVDYIPGSHINTQPLLVSAAAECFGRLGAKTVLVGEGPGHQRDTELVLLESGFADLLRQQRIHFVDLNRDELVETQLLAHYTGMKSLWLPRTVLESDFIVSMPKMKTHHWSGVTLSMKNMFGVVPGVKYGWPKNILHWKGIQESILDICATVPIHFVIADAVVAMEGNGPLNGTPRCLDRIVLADDPVAADATCARLMGLDAEKIAHIRAAARFLGHCAIERIDQLAETACSTDAPFQTVPEYKYLRVCDRPGGPDL